MCIKIDILSAQKKNAKENLLMRGKDKKNTNQQDYAKARGLFLGNLHLWTSIQYWICRFPGTVPKRDLWDHLLKGLSLVLQFISSTRCSFSFHQKLHEIYWNARRRRLEYQNIYEKWGKPLFIANKCDLIHVFS